MSESFIESQRLEILRSDADLSHHLHPGHFRSRADRQTDLPSLDDESPSFERAWTPIPQADLWSRISVYGTAENSTPPPLTRLVLIAESGTGKSIRLRWLQYQAALDSRLVPFLVSLEDVPSSTSALQNTLVEQVKEHTGNRDWSGAFNHLERLRKSGRLLLLFDGLDEARGARHFFNQMASGVWNNCPIVVAGRPGAVYRHRDKFRSFRFVRPDEFTAEEFKAYMGEDKHEKIRQADLADAIDILHNPRIAFYLKHKVSEEKLSSLQSASDVLETACTQLLKSGLTCDGAWRFGEARTMEERTQHATKTPQEFEPSPETIELAHQLLSAIAMEQLRLTTDIEGQPNFSSVVDADLVADLLDAVFERVKTLERYREESIGRKLFDFDVNCLSAANVAITRDLLDLDGGDLRIQWCNKTLQEFYAARYFGTFSSENDVKWLAGQRYHRTDSSTFDLYWVQRYLCELPGKAVRPQPWTEAIAPFFAPGDGTPQGTLRSCEMIYRAWPRLERYARSARRFPLAAKVAKDFLNEFETIRAGGSRDAAWKKAGGNGLSPSQAAQELLDSFVKIDAGCFNLGAPLARQGMSDDLRQKWRDFLSRFDSAEELIADRVNFAIISRTDADLADSLRAKWREIYDAGVDRLAELGFPEDEPQEVFHRVEAFEMGRYPVLNRWYRLFDPGHGVGDSPYASEFERVSPDGGSPAIHLDWYMSWCFALWCRFDGESCELPDEVRWEYAAKGRSGSMDENGESVPAAYQDYWWADQMDGTRCTWKSGQTTKPEDYTRAAAPKLGMDGATPTTRMISVWWICSATSGNGRIHVATTTIMKSVR